MLKSAVVSLGAFALLASGVAFAQPAPQDSATNAVSQAKDTKAKADKTKAKVKKAKAEKAKPAVGTRNGSKVTVKTKNGKVMTYDCSKPGNKKKSFCK